MSGVNGGLELGVAKVITTNNGGLSAEQVSDLCLDRIVGVSETAPEPIKQQALAYREEIRKILVYYMRMAMAAERTTVAAKLTAAGHADVAAAIKEI